MTYNNHVMDINLPGRNILKPSGLKNGALILPEWLSIADNGDLVKFGENDLYVHCIFTNSGGYCGIYKAEDPNHLYSQMREINDLSE